MSVIAYVVPGERTLMRTAPSAADPSENMMRAKVTGSGAGSEAASAEGSGSGWVVVGFEGIWWPWGMRAWASSKAGRYDTSWSASGEGISSDWAAGDESRRW